MIKHLESFCGILAFVPCLPTHASVHRVQKQPNIIFILVDDFRYDAMGYCGNKIVTTPSIDQLATQGTFFKNAFSTTPISSASRASILTGLYERTHRYTFQTGPIDDAFLDHAYPVKLKEAGYHTALFGKLGVNCTDAGSLFDELEEYDRNLDIVENGYYYKTLNSDTVHLTRYTGQKGLDFIDKQTDDDPFFMALCFSAPHAHDPAQQQYFWDENQSGLYTDVTVPDPTMCEDEYFNRLPAFVQNGFSRLRWTWRFDTPEKYQSMMKGYYRMISGIDQEIGKLRKRLQKRGLADNTVIVFMGDNGYFLGERQLADKWLMYDISVRIPLIIYDPRINRHSEVKQQVINVDIPSTLVDLAGGKIPSLWQGKSLVQLLKSNKDLLQRDTILIEHLWEMPNIPSCEGVRTAEWKYFRYINDKRLEELYHLSNDPDEKYDLSKDERYASVMSKLRQKTNELTLRFSANGWLAPDNLSTRCVCEANSSNKSICLQVFGWTLPYFSQSQKAYQILVSSSQADIERNVAEVWNSGCVFSNNSLNATYCGEPLEKGKAYYWRVRYWDYLNRTSPYSDVQKFVYGEHDQSIPTKPMCHPDKDALLTWGISATITNGVSITLAPHMDKQTGTSKLVYPTCSGDLKAECHVTDSKTSYTITVPANVRAGFVIPPEIKSIVLLNGKTQTLNHSILQLKAGINYIHIQNNTF